VLEKKENLSRALERKKSKRAQLLKIISAKRKIALSGKFIKTYAWKI
jgi:hypothetical protein